MCVIMPLYMLATFSNSCSRFTRPSVYIMHKTHQHHAGGIQAWYRGGESQAGEAGVKHRGKMIHDGNTKQIVTEEIVQKTKKENDRETE